MSPLRKQGRPRRAVWGQEERGASLAQQGGLQTVWTGVGSLPGKQTPQVPEQRLKQPLGKQRGRWLRAQCGSGGGPEVTRDGEMAVATGVASTPGLLTLITDATPRRVDAHRKLLQQPEEGAVPA